MKIFKTYILILLAILSTNYVYSDIVIKGKVVDKKTKETIVGANVFIEGTTIGCVTDIDGNFEIKINQKGEYDLVVSFISYKTQKYKINAREKKVFQLNIELEEDIKTIKEVEIVETRKNDTELSMISTIKNTSIVANGISSQQISKTQDRDAAESVKRIPGITILDNRFIMVRGLSERYNVVWLNNLSTPSFESDRRSFSLDMLPTSSIERMIIYKTPAPELPGDFAGGSVMIYSKNIPEKNTISVSFSQSYSPYTTGQTFFEYPIPDKKYRWLCLNDGSRNLPEGFPEHLKYLSNKDSGKDSLKMLGRRLNKKWSYDTVIAPIDKRVSVSWNLLFKGKNFKIGNISNVSYSHTFKKTPFERYGYMAFDTIKECSDTLYSYKDVRHAITSKGNIMHNWMFLLGKKHKFEILNQLNYTGVNRTTFREGVDENHRIIRAYEYKLMNRYIYNGQLTGEHRFFGDNTIVKWAAGYSETQRDEPDTKRLTTLLNTTKEDSLHYNKYYVNFSFAADPRQAGIIFIKMKEKTYSSTVNLEQKLLFNNFEPLIKCGIYTENKDRSYAIRNIGFVKARTSKFNKEIQYLPFDSIFADTNINNTTGLKINEMTKPSDSYTAGNKLLATYLGVKIPLFSQKLNIYTGVRFERNDFYLNSFSSDNIKDTLRLRKITNDIFPSINITYNFNDKKLIRYAYGFTTNRPEFREFAPLNFFDFENYTSVVGNDSLQDAYIHNFDLRYEIYPEFNEMITIGVFYKQFEKPIESVMYNAGTGFNYSFANADKAYSYGSEIEVKKSFKNYDGTNIFLKSLKNFSVLFNASYIKSKVIIKTLNNYFGETERQMQGQSPYIVNAGVLYNNDTLKFEVCIMYNIIGKRLMVVGDRLNPSIYEMPRNQIDVTFSKRFGKNITLKGGIQDLLNEPYVFKQFVNYRNTQNMQKSAEQNTWKYKTGAYYTIGLIFTL